MAESENTGTKPDPVSLSALHSSQLCQACGVCCTGAFFSHVTVTTKEAETLKSTAIKTHVNKKEKTVFDQPCVALSGTSCSIYDKRPGACRAFLCKLTRSVLTGETEFDSALETVGELKALTTWLTENAPMDMVQSEQNSSATMSESVDKTRAAWNAMMRDAEGNAAPDARARSLGLLQLLMGLYFKFEQKQNTADLSEEDKAYIIQAFAFAKLCDRYFEKSRLLRKYAQLIQRM